MYFKSICLSGGGATGFAHLGMLHELDSQGMLRDVDTVVGTSVGAVVGALFAIGIEPQVIHTALLALDRNAALQFTSIATFFDDFGLDTGEYFMAHMVDIFLRHKVDPRLTFKDVRERYRKRLIITGTNTTLHRTEYFGCDETPSMRILDAVRVSIAVPFLFTAVKRATGVYVDGCVTDNYPIKYCLKDFHVRYPLERTETGVVGCCLDSLAPRTTPDLESHIYNVIASSTKITDKDHHTIDIFVTSLSSVDFDATEEQREAAFQEGCAETKTFIADLKKMCRNNIPRRRSVS